MPVDPARAWYGPRSPEPVFREAEKTIKRVRDQDCERQPAISMSKKKREIIP